MSLRVISRIIIPICFQVSSSSTNTQTMAVFVPLLPRPSLVLNILRLLLTKPSISQTKRLLSAIQIPSQLRTINIDLSADHYFKNVGLVSLGLFYKDIKNVNVEWASNKYLGSDLGLVGENADKNFAVTQNINAYDARVYGVEAAYQRDFGFIAPAL